MLLMVLKIAITTFLLLYHTLYRDNVKDGLVLTQGEKVEILRKRDMRTHEV